MNKIEFNFEKFMKGTEDKKNNPPQKPPSYEETPQRQYNHLYQEKWQNCVVWKSKETGK